MKKVEMPKMGDTMEEGKILHWLKKEGDSVKKGESLAEVETDKVNIEIEAFSSGVLRKILVSEGASAPVGAAIALIGAPNEALPLAPLARRQDEAGSSGSTQATAMPVRVTQGVAVGLSAHIIHGDRKGSPYTTGRIFISPIARRLAEEKHLDYAQIHGTGPNGRILKMDVEAILAQQPATVPLAQPATLPVEHAPIPVSAPTFTPEPMSAIVDTGVVVEIPLTAMRRTIASRLSQSMQAAPHFYITSVIDTGRLAALRQQINEFTASDPLPVKVSFNDLILKAVALALVRIPQVNVSFAEDKLLQKKHIHIGIAVALEQGLVVPVLHNADQRGILDIARETRRLTEAANSGKLRPEDLSRGTFTVSNLGMFDVDSFTAVINPPESAILAIGSITPTPAVVDGQVVVRDRMKVTLSSDHRAIDGATAARFLQELKRLVEQPLGLLL